MNPLEQVTTYLKEKVAKTNINNERGSNSGALAMLVYSNWEEEMDHYVDTAFTVIQQQFARDQTDSPAGTAKLTSVSTTIGKLISKRMTRAPIDWNFEVRLGDIFIEAFEAFNLVDLYYPKVRNSSYILFATHKWMELADIPETMKRVRLTGTTTISPPYTTSAAQEILGNSVSLIKGGGKVRLQDPWVKSLNKLQQVGWKINKRVLQALIDNQDEFVSSIPIEDNDAKEQKRRSKKLEWKFIITKAEMIKTRTFYQYLDTDYRGRFYYIEPFLNFQGSDVSRGLMQFAKGKPMTSSGLRWLAIHTASVYNMSYHRDEIPDWCEEDYETHLLEEGLDTISVDKMTLRDRVEWTHNNMKDILHDGEHKRISTTAEKPVSYLSACIEWNDYSRALDVGFTHTTHLPIPIDGSNNGWQHLGAISRDSHTGSLVGLTKVKIQKDFYVQTAKKLISICDDDDLYSILNSMPMKSIRKGISKRGSMTRAYSAGQKKIAENMFFDCKAEDYHITYDIDEKDCHKFAGLLIDAINIVCPGPLTTMAYLQDLAAYEIGNYTRFGPDGEPAGKEFRMMENRRRELYRGYDLSDEELEELNDLVKKTSKYNFKLTHGNGRDRLTWVTPSGFYVNYEKWVNRSVKCKGSIGKRRITHVAKIPTKRPDIRGFMCGISPNFIHSLDASHMALVISQWKGEFGAVHDSFSTHASDVDDLLQLTKDVFIDMYDVPNFYDYIEDQLVTDKTDLDVPQPELGTLDIGGINDSEYFFA